jgi:protein SHQ1
MLTPRFTLDQDENFLVIKIYAPFTNLSETEIFMDETDFRFFSKPYFLRLHLPGEIEENDKASGVYDAETSRYAYFIILDHCWKIVRGT